FNCLNIAKVDVFKLCLSKIRVFDSCILHTKCKLYIYRNLRKQFLFYGKRTTSKFGVIQKTLNIYISLRAEVAINSTVASSEGPSFFQNFHQSIYVFLRIYENEAKFFTDSICIRNMEMKVH
ncbi:hypothetical protein Anas_14213, partial [Armadillidium nasatum]